MFPIAEKAAKKSFFGDRLDHFCYLFVSNIREASKLLTAGGSTFDADSPMVICFLRMDPEEKNLGSMGSEVMNSMGGGAYNNKQRNRETKVVLSVVKQTTVLVWPRDHTCIHSSFYQ